MIKNTSQSDKIDSMSEHVMNLLQEQARQLAEAKQALQQIVRLGYKDKANTNLIHQAIIIARTTLKNMANHYEI